MEKKTINVQDVAKLMGISNNKAYDLCKREDFPSINLGRRVVVVTELFEQWLIDRATNKTDVR